jgi:predicted TIM-barrel fold metal-dependent hydrolase
VSRRASIAADRSPPPTIQDLAGIRLRDVIGVETIMWCNDYPHVDGIWPNSTRSIEEHMAGVPEAERHAILTGNAMRLYGLWRCAIRTRATTCPSKSLG